MTTLGTHAEDKQTNKQHRDNDNFGYTHGRQTNNNKHNTEKMTTLGTHAEEKQTNNNKHNTETMTTVGTHAEEKQTNNNKHNTENSVQTSFRGRQNTNQ